MKQFRLVFAIASVALLAACSRTPADPQVPDAVIPPDDSVIEEGDTGENAQAHEAMGTTEGMMMKDGELLEVDEQGGVQVDENGVRNVYVSMEDWKYEPATITVSQGEQVQMILQGTMDGTRGLVVPGLGISARVQAGQNIVLVIPTGTAGTYPFFNNIPVTGGMHNQMKGTIVIE